MLSAALCLRTVSAVTGSEKPLLQQDDHPVWESKYFHEPSGYEIHYDSRYHRGVVSYPERRDSLIHMIRAYLVFFQEEGLETWLAHGTLLGWWWNGKVSCISPNFSQKKHSYALVSKKEKERKGKERKGKGIETKG